MKFYIASKLTNHKQVSMLAKALTAAGHTLTYDWTCHCSMQDMNEERIQTIAMAETNGVLHADCVIVVLHGGKGTHAELGIAIGAGKKIILCSPDDSPCKADGNTCAFYWHPNVARATGDVADWLAVILKQAAN